jgi:hypothetical protein
VSVSVTLGTEPGSTWQIGLAVVVDGQTPNW